MGLYPRPSTQSVACDSISEKVGVVESTSSNQAGMEDHKEYFWDVVRFKVRNSRFQLPLYRFVDESEYFAAEYKLSDATKEGYAQDVIDLDVDLQDFERFLKVFLPRSPTAYHSKPSLTQAEWISVLKLSTKWQFNDLRKKAIEALHSPTSGGPSLTSIELAILAKEFNVPNWLLEGYKGLIQEMLSLEEKEGKNGREWSEEEVANIGSDVVIELQRIVIGRYRSMVRRTPLVEVREDVMESRLLKNEYEVMKSRAEKYLTAAELKEIEDHEKRERIEREDREKMEKEYKEMERKADEERQKAERTAQKRVSEAKARLEAQEKVNKQTAECTKKVGAEVCCCQVHGCTKVDPSSPVSSGGPPIPAATATVPLATQSVASRPPSAFGAFASPPSAPPQSAAPPFAPGSSTVSPAPPSPARPTSAFGVTKPSAPSAFGTFGATTESKPAFYTGGAFGAPTAANDAPSTAQQPSSTTPVQSTAQNSYLGPQQPSSSTPVQSSTPDASTNILPPGPVKPSGSAFGTFSYTPPPPSHPSVFGSSSFASSPSGFSAFGFGSSTFGSSPSAFGSTSYEPSPVSAFANSPSAFGSGSPSGFGAFAKSP
ncbi:hypothetical protein BKA70DRAFT_1320177 [Coprinopsis sp. MPI-PUGE-AT-0042]|nr:hypothetical protein BKA70DRAFT_1320177 [Coprinopsis sp. MPI-PUGE-AT-0042]